MKCVFKFKISKKLKTIGDKKTIKFENDAQEALLLKTFIDFENSGNYQFTLTDARIEIVSNFLNFSSSNFKSEGIEFYVCSYVENYRIKCKDSYLDIVYSSLLEFPKTMKMVEVETGIDRAYICWIVSRLRKENRVEVYVNRPCKVTRCIAGYLTTNKTLFRKKNLNQYSLFD